MASGKWRPFCLGLNVLTMLMTVQDKLVFVIHDEEFQEPVPSQCNKMLRDTNDFFYSPTPSDRKKMIIMIKKISKTRINNTQSHNLFS